MRSEQRFADYVLFEKLSTTAFGDRFRAGRVLGTVVDSHVLLQLFNGAMLSADSFWQLVADRRSLVETVSDPHLGASIAFDRAESTPYAAYAYAPGRSLDVFLTAVRDQKLPVPVDQALFIIERAALGLTAAHEVIHRGRPVLHGFLVPELIRLSSDGEIRILGIEAAPGLRSQLAAHPAFVSYLAPEVRAGEAPSEADDVFSLGALLFHLLSGKPLPPGAAESAAESVEGAALAAGSEPLPPVIKNLLKNSLAPRANRIPNAVTWQQVLGKIILDGEHNPTTFNLSFLMHTIFRQDLEAELMTIPQELGLRLSAQTAAETPDPSADDEQPVSVPGLVLEEARRPFLTGFMVSFFAALVFIASYFTFFHTPGKADTGGLVSPPAIVKQAAPPPGLVSAGVGERLSDSTAAQGLPVLADVPGEVPDEMPRNEPDEPAGAAAAEAGAQASEAQLQELLTSRTEDLEATLRAEYVARIEDLESRLAADSEPAAEANAAQPLAPPLLTGLDERLVTASETASAEELEDRPGGADLADDPTALEAAGPESLPRHTDPVALEIASIDRDQPTPIEPDGEIEALLPQIGENSAEAPSAMVFEPPRLVNPPRPKYPAAARRLRQAATVGVRVLVDITGTVSETEILGPVAGFGFDSAAQAAAKRSKWSPATRNGEPVASWTLLTIEFRP